MAKNTINEENKGVMQVTVEQWTELMNRLDRAEAGSRGLQKPKRVTEHTAMVRFFEDKPVIRTGAVREKDVDGKQVAFFDIWLLDETKPHNVNYLQFLNVELEGAGVEKVKIVSQKATEHIKSYGQMKAINPDPVNSKNWSGDMIDLDAKSVTYVAQVEVAEDQPHAGLKFEISTQALNN